MIVGVESSTEYTAPCHKQTEHTNTAAIAPPADTQQSLVSATRIVVGTSGL